MSEPTDDFAWPERDEEGRPDVDQSSFGGWLDEIPEPHRWLYASGLYRRPARASITRYHGNPHYYCRISEVDDMVWDQAEGCWRTPWARRKDDYSDEPWKGRQIEHLAKRKFVDPARAQAWVEATVAKHFPPETHRVTFESNGTATMYCKDGD